MLTQLHVKNIVLIENLALDLGAGLTTLTGETGAGKSILLDSLGLVLGQRADASRVRQGAEKGSITAIFECNPDHPARNFLKSQDIECDEDEIIIRRSLTREGRSQAAINDQPVSIGLLKNLGARLVEIHGQFDTGGLLDIKTHRRALDQFGLLNKNVQDVQRLYELWQDTKKELFNAAAKAEDAKNREDYLRYCVEELQKLDPKPGEEDELKTIRSRLINREKIADAYNGLQSIITCDEGLYDLIGRAQAAVDKVTESTGKIGTSLAAALERAMLEIEEAEHLLSSLNEDYDEQMDPNTIEERLFSLKDCARKHNCTIEELPQKKAELEKSLGLIDSYETHLNTLEENVNEARRAYYNAALDLHEKRIAAAQRLTDKVMQELPDLKLDKAKFEVLITTIKDETQWGKTGMDKISFTIATNPGSAPGPLHKIASGGELSRFMLALKLALAETSKISTMIFDEVDSGIGGATADAVGLRLQKLSQHSQIIVVTHSPQVAAKGTVQYRISKINSEDLTYTNVTLLDEHMRLEEIARMLAGAEITAEARAAAAKLMSAQKAA